MTHSFLHSSVFIAAACMATLTRASFGSTIDVTVDTSTLVGQDGGIYFQFNPGLNADPASFSITNFQIGPPGVLEPASPLNFFDGGSSGSLDANNLTIMNSTALNDYGEALKFASTLSFDINLNLPAQLTGNSGSELSIQLTGPDLLTPLLTQDPTGNLIVVSYDTSGAVNVLSTSADATVSAATVPEPSALWSGLVCLLVLSIGHFRTKRD